MGRGGCGVHARKINLKSCRGAPSIASNSKKLCVTVARRLLDGVEWPMRGLVSGMSHGPSQKQTKRKAKSTEGLVVVRAYAFSFINPLLRHASRKHHSKRAPHTQAAVPSILPRLDTDPKAFQY